ncbi:MAG TPA: WbqC family protein [Cyclobacteriaceae bacterium]|nr:WbqC family protein [Cyclobacteriaceae bacterium]
MPVDRTVVVLQSNYLPWKGYFDLMRRADLFIFYDDVQFTKNDWRNRNKIKTPTGAEWISIPCGTNLKRLIQDVRPTHADWQREHWRRITECYASTQHFSRYRPFFEDFYLGKTWTNLSELNQYLIRHIARDMLGIQTTFEQSSQYELNGVRQDRLLDLLLKTGATEYLSGPAARAYISEESFHTANIKLTWMKYGPYPEYPQPYPPFVHEVSIIDLLFCQGPEAVAYLGHLSP